MKTTILVTGGAGYIGSHTVKALQNRGYKVIVLDNLVYGNRHIVEKVLKAKLIVGDVHNRSLLTRIFSTYSISAVIHLAAYNFADRTIKNYAKYHWHNVTGTLALLRAMMAASVNKIIFSSASEIYGIPQQIPITEEHPQHPVDSYGMGKLIIEKMLTDFNDIYGLNSIIFRYFNAAGVDPNGLLGKINFPETDLICSVLMSSLYQRNSIAVFDTNYSTPDGSYVRDYIHVSDLAQAHVLGLEHILLTETSDIFNLGNNDGFSVRQIVETASKVTQKKIKFQQCVTNPCCQANRPTEQLPILVSSNVKAKAVLGWQPQYQDLTSIMIHTWNWYLNSYKLPNNYPFQEQNRVMLATSSHSSGLTEKLRFGDVTLETLI